MAIGLSNGLNSFLKVPPTDWSRPSVWLAAWGRSDSLARLAANPHTESRQFPSFRGCFGGQKIFPRYTTLFIMHYGKRCEWLNG